MEFSYIGSEKGKRKLCFNGHLFYKERQTSDKTFWKCEMYQKTKCRARIHVADNKIVKVLKEHNHLGDAAKVEVETIYENVRKQAVETTHSPNVILSSALDECSQAAASKLPSIGNIKRTMRMIRQRNNACPALPQHRKDISFVNDITKLSSGEEFLFYDSGNVEDRILIFATRRNLQLLTKSEHWYADGTFKASPLLFYQLYTLHGLKQNISLPLVYALLPDKSETTYIKFLEAVKNFDPSFFPSSITTDFEPAMIKATKHVFPNTIQKGCFFHFSQCIVRKIQACGLKQQYETDAEFALKLRMLCALAFVPVEGVVDAFEALCDNEVFPFEAQDVVDYFEDTWIGRPDRRRHRRLPKFPLDMWNVHISVLDNIPKTNNNVEGWHRAFEEQMTSHHPNIWNFLKCMKNEQRLTEVKIEQYISGHAPKKGRKAYITCAERIRRLVSDYKEDACIIEYLRGLAHNFSY